LQTLTTKTEELIAQTVAEREVQQVIAFDDAKTTHPEGGASVERDGRHSFTFDISTVDASVLDPDLHCIRSLVRAVRTGQPTDDHLPEQRTAFFLRPEQLMPGLTVSGRYNVKTGNFADFRMRVTALQSRPFTDRPFSQRRLKSTENYRAAAALACAIRKHRAAQGPIKQEQPGWLHPSTVYNTLGHTASIAISELALAGDMSNLLFVDRLPLWFPGKEEGDEGAAVDTVHIRSTAVSLLPYIQHKTVDIIGSNTRPNGQRTRQSINALVAAHDTRYGGSFLSLEESELLARWFNGKKLAKVEARQQAQAQNRSEFLAA
jgi:hypothetical protein